MAASRDDIPEELRMDSTQISLLDLPPEILEYIIRVGLGTNTLRLQDVAHVSQTCKTLHAFFQPELDKQPAKKLLEYVLQGNQDPVVAIAKANPKLFFIKSTAYDYAMDLEGNRRLIEDWSPYQAFFGTGDPVMLAAVKSDLDAYLATLENGQAFAEKQVKEKFPKGFDFPPSTYDFRPLVYAITRDQQLIKTGRPSAATVAILMQFRKDFKPGVVEVAHHFNMNDMIKVHELYDANWNRWDGEQLSFFSVGVITFLQRLMTAPYLQAGCHGFQHLINDQGEFNQHQPLKRNFEVANNKIVIAPLDTKPLFRFGKNFVLDIYYGEAVRLSGGQLNQRRGGSFWKIMSSKYNEALKIYAKPCNTNAVVLRDGVKSTY